MTIYTASASDLVAAPAPLTMIGESFDRCSVLYITGWSPHYVQYLWIEDLPASGLYEVALMRGIADPMAIGPLHPGLKACFGHWPVGGYNLVTAAAVGADTGWYDNYAALDAMEDDTVSLVLVPRARRPFGAGVRIKLASS